MITLTSRFTDVYSFYIHWLYKTFNLLILKWERWVTELMKLVLEKPWIIVLEFILVIKGWCILSFPQTRCYISIISIQPGVERRDVTCHKAKLQCRQALQNVSSFIVSSWLGVYVSLVKPVCFINADTNIISYWPNSSYKTSLDVIAMAFLIEFILNQNGNVVYKYNTLCTFAMLYFSHIYFQVQPKSIKPKLLDQ